jgi:hypothetical protein
MKHVFPMFRSPGGGPVGPPPVLNFELYFKIEELVVF